MLKNSDIFVVHSEYFEISKSVLEALITGLPLVINNRVGDAVPELSVKICRLVANTEDGYFEGLNSLINDDNSRRALGTNARCFASRIWSPKLTEEKFAEVYKTILGLDNVGPIDQGGS